MALDLRFDAADEAFRELRAFVAEYPTGALETTARRQTTVFAEECARAVLAP